MSGRKRREYSQATRVIVLLARLMRSRTPQSISELAAALEVSERQVYRDVAALEAARVPAHTESGHVVLARGWSL